MTNITGVRTTDNIAQARRLVDMSRDIALLDPNEAPFITLLKLAKKNTRVVFNPKFEWLEDDLLGSWSKVNGAVNSSATAIVVDDPTIFRAGDILKLPDTGENLMVSAVDDTTSTLTVVRAYGTTAAEAIADDADILNIGNAQAENSSQRLVKSTQETNAYNYTQIFRTPIALSGTEAASELGGGRDRAFQRRKASLEHKRDIGRAFYYGERKQDTSGATPRRTMGGLISFLTAGNNTVSFDANTLPLTYANFETYAAQVAFSHGSKEKLLIAGPKLASAINGWAEKQLVTNCDPDATYGIRVKNLTTCFGDLKVIYDPLLQGTVYGGYGMILDMENIRYAYLRDRDTKLLVDIQSPDVDGVIDEYRTECSIEVRQSATHLLITGAY